jgi:exonuclease VII small subunit
MIPPEEETPEVKILKKKLQKAEKLMSEILDDQGDEGRMAKDFKKLQKKRNQYAAELGVDLDGLANAGDDHSIDNFSLDTFSTDDSQWFSTDDNQTDSHAPEIGELVPRVKDEEEKRERASRIEECRRDRTLAKAEEEASPVKAHSVLSTPEEETPEVKILKKKLQKAEKLMSEIVDNKGDEGRTTKEYKKLQKKRNQYAADLGVDLDGLAHAGDDHSIDNFSLDTFSTDDSQWF